MASLTVGALLSRVRAGPRDPHRYYLAHIGLAMSPLSNNALFTTLVNHPFAKLFKRGLNVSLNTDGPMQVRSSLGLWESRRQRLGVVH